MFEDESDRARATSRKYPDPGRNYHVINRPNVHELIVCLISHLPAPVRLSFASRADPPLPRLGSRPEIIDVNKGASRFPPAETGAILSEVMDIQIAETQLERVQ